MNKYIRLIAIREFTQRVKKRSFIIATFLTPFIFGIIMSAPSFFAKAGINEETNDVILVVDQDKMFFDRLTNDKSITYVLSDHSYDESKENLKSNSNYSAMIIVDSTLLKDGKMTIYSAESIPLKLEYRVKNDISKVVKQLKIERYNIDGIELIMADLNKEVEANILKGNNDQETSHYKPAIYMSISMALSMLMYMFIIIYGNQISLAVIEEKSSRVVELIISSVKPINLMMGKIIGIALVAFFQFSIWIILSIIVVTATKLMFSSGLDITQIDGSNIINNILTQYDLSLLIKIFSLNFLYFTGGFLLYGAMFAAIGSAVDSVQETQQFTMPILLPILFSFLGISYIVASPNSILSIIFSLIPFTSPIVMMSRITGSVPVWQILSSLIILYGTFIITVYFASRIYRVGILMYGKKVSWKEMMKWIKYK